MFEYIVIAILVISIPLIHQMAFDKGKKKGIDEFLGILFKSGFETKVSTFEKLNDFSEPNGIVFVGDSITQDYNVYEYFKGYNVYNRGIGGDTTEGLLRRMHASIFNLKPKIVIILMGTNDFGVLNASIDDVFERMKKIVAQIHSKDKHIKIILQSVYPVNPDLDGLSVGNRNNTDIIALNRLYQSIEDVTYINMFELLTDAYGRLKKEYTVEGLHINQNGYEVITREIKKYIE